MDGDGERSLIATAVLDDGVANMMRANSPRKRQRIEEEDVDPGDPWKVVGFNS